MENLFITGDGNPERLVGALEFLLHRAGDPGLHSVTSVRSLEELVSALPESAAKLEAAIWDDGVDPRQNHGLTLAVLHMVSGRVERDVLSASLVTTESLQSTVTYIIEGPELLGRRYRLAYPDFVFLEHEIRTDDREQVFVTGNHRLLGNWNPDLALPLGHTGFGGGGHHWFVRLPVPKNETIEFKFIKKAAFWEGGANRTFTGNADASTSDAFRL